MNMFAKNLKYLRKSKGMNQEELARALGCQKTTISNYETTYSEPKRPMLEQIADFFSVSVADLISTDLSAVRLREGGLTPDDSVSVPVYASINNSSSTPPVQVLEFPVRFLGSGNFFGLKISGERMNRAMLTDGSIAIIRKQDHFDNGDIVVVAIENEPAFVSRYYPVGEFISLVCDSSNPTYQPIMINPKEQTCKLYGKVIKCIQDIK